MVDTSADDAAFRSYRAHLGKVVEYATTQTGDPSARWSIIDREMAEWSERVSSMSRQITNLVHELRDSISPEQTQERARSQGHEQSSMEHSR